MTKKTINISQESLELACAKLPITVPKHILPDLGAYLSLLMQWNKVMNLVGTGTWQDCLAKLLIDSFYADKFIQNLNLSDDLHTWDLGAGAGLPGVVLRLLWTKGQYHLVEAREKRALFLQTVLTRVKLQNTKVFHGRAENFFTAQKHNPAQMVISRAFMPWQDVLNLVQNQIHPKGYVVFLTLEAAPKDDLIALGWQSVAQQSYIVENTTRTIWAVCKQ